MNVFNLLSYMQICSLKSFLNENDNILKFCFIPAAGVPAMTNGAFIIVNSPNAGVRFCKPTYFNVTNDWVGQKKPIIYKYIH